MYRSSSHTPHEHTDACEQRDYLGPKSCHPSLYRLTYHWGWRGWPCVFPELLTGCRAPAAVKIVLNSSLHQQRPNPASSVLCTANAFGYRIIGCGLAISHYATALHHLEPSGTTLGPCHTRLWRGSRQHYQYNVWIQRPGM